jgi:ATP-dependent DNA helicase DinG
LFGVASFWQGVDIPGDDLKGLFVHKIPFPSPQEPITKAMSNYLDGTYGKGASFRLWSVPHATTMLQQGMGRLIRTTTDTGVIVVADQRLRQYRYGRNIIKDLPSFSQFPSLQLAKQMFPEIFEITRKGKTDE